MTCTISSGFLFFFFLARNEQFGIKAVQQIHELNHQTREKVYFHQLDIADVESIRRFADYIKKKHEGLDILINNAGIAFQVDKNMIERRLNFIEKFR
jgi:NAD(P)-dependent dehydrogenase (short-subunit alcohol dehydrogenase family)